MRLIDTSVLIDDIGRGVYEEGYISVITLIEVLRGLRREKRAAAKELLEKSFGVLPLDNDVVTRYCEIYAELKRRGSLLPDADLLIAATAISKGLVLVTMDKGFERLRGMGLRMELRRR